MPLVGVLLLLKVVMVVLLVATSPSDGPAALTLETLAWSAPVALATLLVFALSRLPGLEEEGFGRSSRAAAWSTVLVFSPVLLLGISIIVVTASGDLPVVLTMCGLVAAACAAARTGGGRSRRLVLVTLCLGSSAAVVHVWLSASRALPPRGAGLPPDAGLRAEGLGGYLLVAVVVCLLGVVLLLLSRRLRGGGVFLVAVLVWTAATVVPTYVTRRPAATPLAFDLLLTLGLLLLWAAWVTGHQARVDPRELALLAVISLVVVDLPMLVAALAQPLQTRWPAWLLALAVALPAVLQLTLDSRPLNVPGPERDDRVLAVVGAMCLAYGLATTLLVAAAPWAIEVVRFAADFASGLLVIPFAVLLAASTSARLGASEGPVPAVPRRGRHA